jgi:hypothetical protein
MELRPLNQARTIRRAVVATTGGPGVQCEQARQVDDRGGSVRLEVDLALVIAAQVVQEPERRAAP